MDQLSDDHIAEFKEVFSLFDDDKDGIIPTSKFGTLMRSIGHNHTEAELNDMIIEVDGLNGTVKLSAFLSLMTRRIKNSYSLSEVEVRGIFKMIDKNEDELISSDELRYFVNNVGETQPDEEVDEMVKKADVNGDGIITYDGFLKMMMGNS